MTPKATSPRVSVWIPTRNRAKYLMRAIESILHQTFTDFVLVVSDNASTDETRDVVRSFSDPRLKYERLPSDVGLLANFNRCLDRADTEYVLELADDDFLHREHLTESVSMLDRYPRAGMVHCAFDVIGPEGEIIFPGINWTGFRGDVIEQGHDFIRACIRAWSRVAASTALIRRSALPLVKFDAADFPPTDFGLWLRLALNWDIAFLGRALAAYRIHPSSHSALYGMYTGRGYIDSPMHVIKVREVKLRFLTRFGHQFADYKKLRAAAHRSTRELLISHAGRRTFPERRLGRTISELAAAARFDPLVALNPAAWRLLIASLVGLRVREAFKRRLRVTRRASLPVE